MKRKRYGGENIYDDSNNVNQIEIDQFLKK